MKYLLDSSAFFAYVFGEPGGERVRELLETSSAKVAISALSAVEFWSRLKAEGHASAFDREWNDHLRLFDGIVGIDMAVCLKAVELRRASRKRLPTVDSLIAACAAKVGATLVHRDPHFKTIPVSLLHQEVI